MRVRVIELRILAVTLTVLWLSAFALVTLGYRPGGPIDLLVGLAAAGPIVIAAAAVVWPPAARGDRAFGAILWLGIVAVLLLVPSIGGLLGQLRAGGPQTLLPSLEAAYPWLLALVATGVFAGLGIARRRLGQTSLRRRRLVLGSAIGLGASVLAGSTFAGAAIANELALHDRPAASSRFGPTDPDLEPPACAGLLATGPTARLDGRLEGDIDGRSIGGLTLSGVRAGADVRWLGFVATSSVLGQHGVARIGESAWSIAPGSRWVPMPLTNAEGQDLDLQVVRAVLTIGDRQVAEMLGIEIVEGARARHCRIAIAGDRFRDAVPQVGFLVGGIDLERWRGQLDYWVFADGQLGLVEASLNGAASDLAEDALLATIRYRLSAVDRGTPIVVPRPRT